MHFALCIATPSGLRALTTVQISGCGAVRAALAQRHLRLPKIAPSSHSRQIYNLSLEVAQEPRELPPIGILLGSGRVRDPSKSKYRSLVDVENLTDKLARALSGFFRVLDEIEQEARTQHMPDPDHATLAAVTLRGRTIAAELRQQASNWDLGQAQYNDACALADRIEGITMPGSDGGNAADHWGVTLSKAQYAEICELVQAGRRIDSIKAVRYAAPVLGLKEAKDWTDAHWTDMGGTMVEGAFYGAGGKPYTRY